MEKYPTLKVKLPTEHKEEQEEEQQQLFHLAVDTIQMKTIQRDLLPDRILGYLYQEDVLDEDDMEEIQAKKTRNKKTKKLINILQTKPDSNYAIKTFIEILKKYQPHLVNP